MRLSYSLAALLLCACNVTPDPGEPGADGESCSVQATDAGALIECPDGTSVFVENGFQGAPGDTGDPGDPGTDGEDGSNPDPCSIEQVDGGAMVTCPDGSNQFLPDGEDVSTVDEPAGVNCVYGGTAFLVNGEVVGYACNGRGFVDCDQPVVGNVTIDSYLDLPLFAGCSVFEDDLTIRGINDVGGTFLNLVRVGGTLRIQQTELNSLDGFSSLTEIGQAFLLLANHQLSSFGGFLPAIQGNGIVIESNSVLSQCDVDDFLDNIDIGNPSVILNIEFDNLPCVADAGVPDDAGVIDAG